MNLKTLDIILFGKKGVRDMQIQLAKVADVVLLLFFFVKEKKNTRLDYKKYAQKFVRT